MSMMLVLFVGHGSPANVALDNPFTGAVKALGRQLPRPKAMLCRLGALDDGGGTAA
jgi:4,5-DOPA dioxygenase extradiol